MHLKPAMEIRTRNGHLVGLVDDPHGSPLRTVVRVTPKRKMGDTQFSVKPNDEKILREDPLPITLQRVEYSGSPTLKYEVWLISDDDVDRLPERGYARRIDARLLQRC